MMVRSQPVIRELTECDPCLSSAHYCAPLMVERWVTVERNFNR